MEFTAVVIFKRALAHYSVKMKGNDSYEAGLLKYSGEAQDSPPSHICFIKEGRHCTGDINDQDLLDDIYNAVHSKQEKNVS
jgi:hypothetical protein